MNRKVCIAIVTYNRIEYLKGLLNRITELDYPVSGLVIVDNFSQDSTENSLIEMGVVSTVRIDEISTNIWKGIQVYYFRSSYNSGGSGGFAKAFEIAKSLTFDCLWAMDDDVEPEKDCLRKMLKYLDQDARMVIPCRGDENFEDYAIQNYDLQTTRFFHINQCKRNRVLGRTLTCEYVYVEDMAFEGPLMDMELVHEIGIPNKNYFIFFDDTDYAHRALEKTKIRYIRDAKLHKKIIPKIGITWSWKSYYNFRNSVYFDKTYGKTCGVRYVRPFLRLLDLVLRAIIKKNFYRIKWLFRGYLDGVSGKMGKTYDISEIPNNKKLY